MINITFKIFYSWSSIISISFHSLVLWAAYHHSVVYKNTNTQQIILAPVDIHFVNNSEMLSATHESLPISITNNNSQVPLIITEPSQSLTKKSHRMKSVSASKKKFKDLPQSQINTFATLGYALKPQSTETLPIITHPARCEVQDKQLYPEQARLSELSGKVVIHMIVTAQGHINHPQIIHSSGYDELDHHALNQIQLMICQPAMHHEQPITTKVEVPLEYFFSNSQ